MTRINKLFLTCLIFLFIVPLCAAFYTNDLGEYDNYLVGQGDTVRIEIYDSNDTEMIALYKEKVIGYKAYEGWGDNYKTNQFTVPVSGVVSITGFGDVYVKNKTIKTIREDLYQRALSFDKSPKVFVRLLDEKQIRVYILGSVKTPGLYEFKDDGKKNNIMNVLALAGGYKTQSDVTQVTVRKSGSQQEELITVNRTNFNAFALSDGDTVYVSEASDGVIVYGEVRGPGRYSFEKGQSLQDYLARAGGIMDSASREIYIVNEDEQHSGKVFISSAMAYERHEGQVGIKPGTIIYIPKNFFATWKDVLGNLLIIRDTARLPKEFREATDDKK